MTRLTPFLISAIVLTIANFVYATLSDQALSVAAQHSYFQNFACAVCYFNYRFGDA